MDMDQFTPENSYASSMLCILKDMRANQLLTDVIIECDGRQFHAHRVILSAGTQYFRAMFSNGMRETYSRKVCLKEVDPDMFEIVLDFLYSGTISVALEVNGLLALLSLVDKLEVALLYRYCWEELLRLLNCDNFSSILEAAVFYAESTMLEKLVSYFAINAAQIQETKEFLNLSAETLTKLLQSFKCNSVPSHKQYDLITAAVNHWVKAASGGRTCTLLDLADTKEKEVEYKSSTLNHFLENTDDCETSQRNLEMLFLKNVGMCNATAQSYSFTDQCWKTCKLMPCVLNEGASTIQYERCVYLIGGRDSELTTTSNVLAYDYQNNVVWKVYNMAYPRQHCGAAVLDGILYVVGGWNRGQSLKTAECYISKRNHWQEISPMNQEHSSPSAVATCGRVYVVGSHQSTPVIEQYQPFNNQWNVISSIPNISQWNLPLVAANWGKIYVHNRQGTLVNVFDCERQTWVTEELVGLSADVDHMWASGNDKISCGLLIFSHPSQGIITVKPESKEISTPTTVCSVQSGNKMYVILMHS